MALLALQLAWAQPPRPAQSAMAAPAASSADSQARETLSAMIQSEQSKTKSGALWDTLLFPPGAKIEDLRIDNSGATIIFNRQMGDRVWTPESRARLEAGIRAALSAQLPPAAPLKLQIRFSEGRGDDRFSQDQDFDLYVVDRATIQKRQAERQVQTPPLAAPVIARPDYAGGAPTAGLQGRNIVLGPSHGSTWHKENRWQFQRAYLFTTIEDLYPMSYVNQFLIPMLENAGAVVWNERERDFQTAEVIVDNDGAQARSEFKTTGAWESVAGGGWRGGRPASLDETTMPFTLGTTLKAAVGPTAPAPEAIYIPYIPKDGRYAVYASWHHAPENSPSVLVRVRHLGGTTTVRVNQQVAGETWVFLGFFEFAQGASADQGSVTISAEGATPSEAAQKAGRPTFVTADAVRFGGGMGNVAPGGEVSGLPRYAEAARYWLQYAGAPADLVYLMKTSEGHFGVDYNRDITSRGEWANYLQGAPNGPNKNLSNPGLGVPIDLFLAWHTDAGTSMDDIIGTLAIYRIMDDNDKDRFPDGRSRWLNRDLTSLIQDEICRTARANFTSTWARRACGQGYTAYGEARRPNMPSTLLELLSHQNLNDMKYGLDPRWRRDISRSIYKAMLKFVAWSNGYDPIVTPLEPTHLAARHLGGGRVELAWRAQMDPLEPTATPDGYIVYMGRDGRSYDNGRRVEGAEKFVAEGIAEGTTTYFRVTAYNRGGESFPTSVVAVRWVAGKNPVLLVDGFNRICGPVIMDGKDAQGFDRRNDPGVPYQFNCLLVGDERDFDTKSEWENDLETPGWGGSIRDRLNVPERGNTFDHIAAHARALEAAGAAFDSATAQAFAAGAPEGNYELIDWIAGRQRATPPPETAAAHAHPDKMKLEFAVFEPEARTRLEAHLGRGGRLFLSGAYIIDDLIYGAAANDASRQFAKNVLGIDQALPRATRSNTVRVPEAAGPAADPRAAAFAAIRPFSFGLDFSENVYPVESAEGFTRSAPEYIPIMEYADTKAVAALAGNRAVVLGFPLETIVPEKTRNAIMAAALKQLAPALAGAPPAAPSATSAPKP